MIPTTNKIGIANPMSPLITSPTKNNGNKITENTILEIPHVALIANNRIFPNTTNNKIVNSNVNNLLFPPFDS